MCLFTTNGMLIIDEIESDNKHYYNVLGGGGTYAMMGAAICCINNKLKGHLMWIADRGSDFPEECTKEIETWGTGCVFRDDSNRLTTRGYNLYGINDYREFKYLTPKRRIDVSDWNTLFGQKSLRDMRCFHLLCSSERVIDILTKLESYQIQQGNPKLFVWEPIPDLCDLEHFEETRAILNSKYHFIFSPNAEEGARMLGENEPLDIDSCKRVLLKFGSVLKKENICVLRCGKLGSLTMGPVIQGSREEREVIHFPAYHDKSQSSVIDPTGGGNTFLGGFSLAYALTNDLNIASICGNIAAGCAIEQIGMPTYDGTKWNGSSFDARLGYYLRSHRLGFEVNTIVDKLINYNAR